MNTADSERLGSALEQMGLQPVERAGDADVIVLNSCVVRQSAEDKVVGYLSSTLPLKRNNPDRVVALMGCMVGPKTDELVPPVSLRRRLHAPPAVRAPSGVVGTADGLGLGGLRRCVDPNPPRRHVSRSHHPRVRSHVHLLHHSLPPRPSGEPSAGRGGPRGRIAGRPGSQGGNCAGADRGRLRPRPA